MIDVLYEGPEGWGGTAYPDDAGIDLPIVGQHVLAPGERVDLPSGVKIALPPGYYGRITGRSSALRKRGIRVYEGIIDAGFRGELFSYVENASKIATQLDDSHRVAQIIIQPVITPGLQRVSVLPESTRGTRGFGSSDERQQEGMSRPVIDVYVGGPIDYKDGAVRQDLITRMRLRWPQVTFFDPMAANMGDPDPQAVWSRNNRALDRADIATFFFDDPKTGYGFGSPIEIASVAAKGKKVIIWHNGDEVGVYLRKLWQDGVIIALSWSDFERVLGEEITKVAGG